MLCDPNVKRSDIVPLTTAMTPAKIVEVVSHMNAFICDTTSTIFAGVIAVVSGTMSLRLTFGSQSMFRDDDGDAKNARPPHAVPAGACH